MGSHTVSPGLPGPLTLTWIWPKERTKRRAKCALLAAQFFSLLQELFLLTESQLCWRGKSLGRSPALVLLVGEGIRGPQWDADVRVSRAPGSGRGGGHAAPPCSQPAWGAGSVHEGRAPKLPAVLPGATACQARPGGLHPRAGLIALREGPPWWGRCSQGWSRPGGTLVLLRMGLSLPRTQGSTPGPMPPDEAQPSGWLVLSYDAEL